MRPNPAPSSLALIFCYHNPLAISRKVDPDLPRPIQQQRLEAVDVLAYDRRTGRFWVPDKGKVFLYDRSDNSRAPGMNLDGGDDSSRKPAGTEPHHHARIEPAFNRVESDDRRTLGQDPRTGGAAAS